MNETEETIIKLEKKKKYVSEMFPNLKNEIIDRLFEVCDDININITKILDNNYEGLQFNLKELIKKPKYQKSFSKELYYPELFNNSFIDVQDGDKWLEKVEILFNKLNFYKTKVDICKDKRIFQFYKESIQKLHQEIKILNRKRVLCILKKSLTKMNGIDLHGLFTKEALMFVSDFLQVYKPSEINLVTGCDGHSQSLRPSLINYLQQKGYVVIENNGPCIQGRKKKII